MTPRTVPIFRTLLPSIRRPRSTADRRRAARRTVLLGLTLIAFAFLAMAAAVETRKPEWRDPEYGHRLKQLRGLRAAHPHRPLVVAVGSSRTQMGISPATLDRDADSPLVYNFGQSGAGPLHILLTVQRLLDDGVEPDFLLVELFPATLAHDGPAERQFERILPRLSLADLRRLEPYTQDSAALRRRWAGNRVNAWHTHRLTLMSHWQPNWLPMKDRVAFQWQQMDAFGFTPYPHEVMPPGERERGLEQVRKDYAPGLANLHVGATADRAFRDLISRCRAAGIPVAFYLMPESPAFLSWYTTQTHATFAAYRDALAHDLGAPVFDAAAGFAEDEFADGHHLLRHGAARFTRRLFAGCVRPWVCGVERRR